MLPKLATVVSVLIVLSILPQSASSQSAATYRRYVPLADGVPYCGISKTQYDRIGQLTQLELDVVRNDGTVQSTALRDEVATLTQNQRTCLFRYSWTNIITNPVVQSVEGSSTCWTFGMEAEGRSIAFAVYLWALQVRYCAETQAYVIVEPKPTYAAIPMWTSPLYFFKGNVGEVEFGGVGQNFYTAGASGQYEFCLAGIQGVGCIGQFFPRIEMTVLASGGYTYKHN